MRPSIMSLGATTSAPASTCETAVRAISSMRRVVVDLVPSQDAAVPVRRVLAEAHVGHQQQLREARPQRAQRLLDDAVLDPRARALVVLLLGDAEEDHGVDAGAEQLLAFADDAVHGVPRKPGQPFVRQRLGRDEERLDEVVERDGRLAHEVAQRTGAAQPAESRGRERAHRKSVRARWSGPPSQPSSALGSFGSVGCSAGLDADRDRARRPPTTRRRSGRRRTPTSR